MNGTPSYHVPQLHDQLAAVGLKQKSHTPAIGAAIGLAGGSIGLEIGSAADPHFSGAHAPVTAPAFFSSDEMDRRRHAASVD